MEGWDEWKQKWKREWRRKGSEKGSGKRSEKERKWKRKLRKLAMGCLAAFVVAAGGSLWVLAAEEGRENVGNQFSDYDFSQIEQFLKENGETDGLSFTELMKKLVKGEGKEAAQLTAGAVKDSLFSQIGGNGSILIQIIALGLAGAVFTNFSGVFSSSQVSETGFFVTYLLIFSYLGVSFFTSVALAGETMEKILEFVRLLMPSYFMAVAFSGGSASSIALYETMLFAVSAVEWLFVKIFLPFIKIYLLLALAGHIAKEDMLSRLTEMIRSGVSWGMKTVIGVILGLNMLQGMIMPYVDAVKNSTMEKAIEAIPGIGKGAGIAAQLMLGSGILIKNTMGVAAAVILLILTAMPVIKLAVLALMYQCAAAALEPVCDKRIIACVGAAAEGHKLLLKLLTYSALLFILAIAVICNATNAVYFGG